MVLELSEEEKKKQLEAQQSGSLTDPAIGSGGGAEIQSSLGGSTPASSGRLSPTTQSTPQKFGTIQDYFKGSKQQGERFGEQFTGKLGEAQEQQRGQIGQAATGATQDITAGTIGFDQGLVSTALADPTKVAGDEAQFTKFLEQWNAAYKGPESFEGSTQYSQAAKAAQDAASKATQLGTTGGRQQIIQDEFGVYGRGKKGLDEALLQQSSYFPKVQEQVKGFQTIQDYLQQQSGEVGTAAQKARETTKQTKTATRAPFEGTFTKFQTDLTNRVEDARQKAKDVGVDIQKVLQTGGSNEVYNQLIQAGIPVADANKIRNDLTILNREYQQSPDLRRYYESNPNIQILPSNIATTEDYQRAAAYQNLTGQNYGGILNPANIEQAGTAQLDPEIDTESLSEYLRGDVTQRDKQTMSGRNLIPDLNDIKSDKGAAHKLVQRYIRAAERSAKDPKNPAEIRKLLTGMYQKARSHFLSSIPYGDYALSPSVSGLKLFTDILGERIGQR